MKKIMRRFPKYVIYKSDRIYRKKDVFPFDESVWFKCSRTKKELIAYTQFHKTDWINIARGPTQFVSMPPRIYHKCLEVIDQGKVAIYAKIYWLSELESIRTFMKNKKVKKYYEG